MPGQQMRKKNVRRKLNPIRKEFLGKNVLLVDDSIVRGTTATQIVAVSWSIGRKKNIKRKNQSGSGEENEIK